MKWQQWLAARPRFTATQKFTAYCYRLGGEYVIERMASA